ncbi:MAG: alpha-galactosidase [Phycisphaeraceae bacterium]
MPLKVTFIGAGSVGFTRTLVRDMLSVPELQDTEFALHDISRRNLDMVAQILKKDVKANKLPAKITTSLQRRRALEGADYVINCTRIGGLDAFATDIDIPLKYGVDQCVGDTLCAGGIMYGQRNIPQIRAFQRDMLDVGNTTRPGGMLFLNYANPMAMNTWAALDAYDDGEGVDTVGLCHGVEGGWRQIAHALAHLRGDKAVDHRRDVEIICAGINHQTWYVDVRYKGQPVDAEELLEAFEKHPTYAKTEKCRIDVLRRFGCYSTESNGHLSEYLPWYRKQPKEIRKWIDLSSWINGETGGYLRVCTEGRNWFETDFPNWLKKAGAPMSDYTRSSEHGSYIIEARETGRTYRGHFNVRNNGVIPSLPEDCIIEAPGFVDRFGINMVEGIDLPLACAATCQASVDVQRMATEAAVHGDVTLLKQAMLHDPLVGAVCSPDEVWQMADEMLVAQAKWLPQYSKRDINAAKKRLANATVKTRNWKGAARLKTKSVGELRKARDASVLEADKAAAGRAKDAAATRATPKRRRVTSGNGTAGRA